MDSYKTIAAKSEGLFKDKGSRFVAYAFPVTTEDEIREHLVQVKKEHHSARHHCYAWRLGAEEPAFRIHDGGEPSSTAGKPILGQLIHFEVTNVLLVVVRYFGGVLLGTGGLINAYRSAAADALSNAEIITKIIKKKFRLKFSYNELNDVMQAVKQENLTVVNTVFEVDCQLDFTVRESESNRIYNFFNQMYPVKIEML
jgi:uncharacterized YigZ family protein